MSREIIEVYAHWQPIAEPLLVGHLSYADSSRGGVFGFEYSPDFLASSHCLQIDPALHCHYSLTIGQYSCQANFSFWQKYACTPVYRKRHAQQTSEFAYSS